MWTDEQLDQFPQAARTELDAVAKRYGYKDGYPHTVIARQALDDQVRAAHDAAPVATDPHIHCLAYEHMSALMIAANDIAPGQHLVVCNCGWMGSAQDHEELAYLQAETHTADTGHQPCTAVHRG